MRPRRWAEAEEADPSSRFFVRRLGCGRGVAWVGAAAPGPGADLSYPAVRWRLPPCSPLCYSFGVHCSCPASFQAARGKHTQPRGPRSELVAP